MFYVIEIALWLIGLAISLSVYKKINILCTENNAGLDEKTLAELAEQNETTKKHFYVTGIYFPIVIVLGIILPWTPVKWILFFGCAFTIPPIFYDVFNNNLKRTFESKERFLFTVISAYNLALISVTMFVYYFAYMHVDFTK